MIQGDTVSKKAGQVSLFLLTGTFFSQFLIVMQPLKTSSKYAQRVSILNCLLPQYNQKFLYDAHTVQSEPSRKRPKLIMTHHETTQAQNYPNSKRPELKTTQGKKLPQLKTPKLRMIQGTKRLKLSKKV